MSDFTVTAASRSTHPLPALMVDYVSEDAGGTKGHAGVLARVHFRAGPTGTIAPGDVVVPLDPLSGSDASILECWQVDAEVQHGTDGDLSWSCGGDWLMVSLRVDENAHGGPRGAALHAYRRLLTTLEDHDHPHLMRVWNYLADINMGDGDDERYRQFTIGRAEGMAGVPAHRFPAATAIGRTDGIRELVVYALAARQQGVPIENPRQVSAYRYPRQYGPVPPSFARAMRVDGIPATLLVSGTASVVGHASVHDRPCAQVEETLRNLSSLLVSAGMATTPAQGTWLRVYVRDPADVEIVRRTLDQHGIPTSRLVFLHGEICRRELLIEVDGVIVDH